MTTAEQIAQKVLQEHGSLRTPVLEERLVPVATPSFEAFTDLSSHHMTVRYSPQFPLPPQTKHFAHRKNVGVALETCLRDILGHECGHVYNQRRVACPETLPEHEQYFYEPIAAILKKKGKLGAVDAVSNLVEDLINNAILAQGAHAGLTLFYHDVAVTSGWKPDYEAYMRIQLYCWGDAADKKLLTKHYTAAPEVIKATQAFLQKLEERQGKKGKKKHLAKEEKKEDQQEREKRLSREEVAAYFKDKENWKTIAQDFTTALEPLIPAQPDFPLCGHGKQMKEAMNDPSNRERFARGRYSRGERQPSWMPKEEALDAVYSSLAREIQVKVDHPRKATSFPLVPYRYEPFNPEEHPVSHINFRRLIVVPERETPFGLTGANFGVAKEHLEQPLLVKKGITSFPPCKSLYVDCSISMKEGIPDRNNAGSTRFIPWGDQSKYHYSCRAWYGMIEYLARQGILPNVEIGLGVFSDSSRVVSGLEEAKKLLFNPSFGNTNIDIAALDRLLAGGKAVFSTVSDGEVQNWSTAKEAFLQRAKQHYYFHIQLGGDSVMSRDVRNAGLPSYTVNSGEDFERLAIDLTNQMYQQHIQTVLEALR